MSESQKAQKAQLFCQKAQLVNVLFQKKGPAQAVDHVLHVLPRYFALKLSARV